MSSHFGDGKVLPCVFGGVVLGALGSMIAAHFLPCPVAGTSSAKKPPLQKSKRCVPCEGSVKKLDGGEMAVELAKLKSGKWIIVEGETPKLRRKFVFKGNAFMKAVGRINDIAELAELEGHHPDLLLQGWKNLTVEIYTHAIGGLSINDFILAEGIDEIVA